MDKEKWLVAVSGGPDSMALLHILQQQNYELSVAHVNYHQRPESNDEEEMVKDYCLNNGLSFYSVDFDIEVDGNFQHIARNFRYHFFSQLINELGLRGVMVGHHYDDHIETYLIQKERQQKSKVIGLSTDSVIKGVLVKRPLLKYTKEELIKICKDSNIPYSVDSSNNNPKYTRNRIRLAPKDLLKIEESMSKDKMVHKQELIDLDKMILDLGDNIIYYHQYSQYEVSLRMLFLRLLLENHGIDVHHYREKYFEELDRQILNGKGVQRYGNKSLFMEQKYFIISERKSYSYTLDYVDQQEFPEFKFADKGSTNQSIKFKESDFPITVRNVQSGDSIEMRFGRKKVSRYFVDNKIPHYQRENWLVIENAVKECIYVMGMGCDVHHYANNSRTYVLELNLL